MRSQPHAVKCSQAVHRPGGQQEGSPWQRKGVLPCPVLSCPLSSLLLIAENTEWSHFLTSCFINDFVLETHICTNGGYQIYIDTGIRLISSRGKSDLILCAASKVLLGSILTLPHFPPLPKEGKQRTHAVVIRASGFLLFLALPPNCRVTFSELF